MLKFKVNFQIVEYYGWINSSRIARQSDLPDFADKANKIAGISETWGAEHFQQHFGSYLGLSIQTDYYQ